ncbi:MAG: hypothetical protein NT098_01945 [Candidatus Parcubacteria bacterium]|nr:hypothetical protein [Candidatus Parcubacteria bacterium]
MARIRKIYWETFPENTKQEWKVKAYSWGLGYVPLGKFVTLRNEKPVALRLVILNPEAHTPQAGEVWQVTPTAWTLPGKKDKEGRTIAVVEGTLDEKVVQVEKTFDHRARELKIKTRCGAVVREETKKLATDVVPFRDPADHNRVLYMEVTLVEGKIAKKKLQRVGTLENYVANRAANLRELIEGGLENPYKGSRKTKGVIEKYCKTPLEEIITLPPFLS